MLPGNPGGSNNPGGGTAGMDTRPSMPDRPDGAAFDTIKGSLDVKYPELMSQAGHRLRLTEHRSDQGARLT